MQRRGVKGGVGEQDEMGSDCECPIIGLRVMAILAGFLCRQSLLPLIQYPVPNTLYQRILSPSLLYYTMSPDPMILRFIYFFEIE